MPEWTECQYSEHIRSTNLAGGEDKETYTMNIALWVVQGLLALMFAGAGVAKLTQSKEKLSAQMPWVEDYAASTVKLIGGLELLGAIGLIVPMLTGILPILTPLAAIGLVLTMIGAIVVHVRRRETQRLGINVLVLVLAAVVAVGRLAVVSG